MFFSLQYRKCHGYTLIEIVSALAAFTLIMMVISGTFARSLVAYKTTKTTQVNLETAQFVLNLIAKELRTSSVVANSASGANPYTIKFYDYSQARCIEYSFNSGTGVNSVTRRSVDATAFVNPDNDPNIYRSSCASHTFGGSSQALLNGLTAQSIVVVPSVGPNPNPQVGKVTITLSLGTGSNQTAIQTTVSLRDFNYTNI